MEPSQDEKVNSSLYPEFYMPELKALENTFTAGNSSDFNDAYNKIEKRIQIVYESFNTTYTKTLGEPAQKIEGLKSAIKEIQTIINTKYSVPPKYIENLQDIAKSLSTINNQ
ncbi:MAG: hypothetical protein WCL18_02380 [bacterium]